MINRLSRIRDSLKREEVRSISRRYFLSNGFDGTLTGIGIAVGSFLSGIDNNFTVFQVGLGAAVGLATSGVWSVWEIEKAEKLAELHQLEESMMEELEGTAIHERKKEGREVNAIMSGLGPVLGVIIPLTSFLVISDPLKATLTAIAVACLQLFTFGAYMARISKQQWYIAGLRMGVAGIVVAILNIFLPG